MKMPKVIQVTYGLGGQIFDILEASTNVINITDPAPGIVRVNYENNVTEVIISDQMIVKYKVDDSKIETIDMDVARVS